MKLLTVLLASVVAMIAGCESTPNYLPPTADECQVLIRLQGQPKTGVTDAKEEVTDLYSGETMSVENGKKYERVDYDEIENVIVILERVDGSNVMLRGSSRQHDIDVDFDEDGFSIESPIVLDSTTSSVTFRNQSSSAMHVFGVNGKDISFELKVEANRNRQAPLVLAKGLSHHNTWELSIDENDDSTLLIIVTNGISWTGASDEQAFFEKLVEGEYILRVIAPRLPEVRTSFIAVKGERKTVDIKLTVNNLPKAK